MNIKILYFLILPALVFTGCANQTSPTGGPKDTIPPSLVSSIPVDQTINFQGGEIVLTFDEYIRLNNARQQIIITPLLEQDITYTFRRNKAFIEFSEPLAPNTTYSINFREGIRDITENNPARIKLAFSTGDYIDSLELSGVVYDPLKGEPLEDILVCLQEPVDTTYYFLQPALYFTRSAKDGTFNFTNLKNADFHLYAFNDVNNDLKLQARREKHGFLPELIRLQSDTSGFEIPLVNNNTDTLELVSARQAGRYFEVNFNKFITSYSVNFNDGPLPYMLTEDHTSIRFFNLPSTIIPVHVTAEDSIEYRVEENIDLSFSESARNPYEFIMQVNTGNIVKTDPKIKSSISFNKPIHTVLHDSLFVFVDSLNIFPITEEYYTFDSSKTLLEINYPLDAALYQQAGEEGQEAPTPVKKQATYIHFGRGAFLSVEGDSSRRQQITPKMFTPDQLGILNLEVDVTYDNFIVELLNSKNEVIERRYNEHEIRFTNLLPATYYVRVLQDIDQDKFWDPGNIYSNRPPEDVLHYINPENKKDVILRANWEIGPYTISN